MARIVVVGNSGGGKSTLARAMAAQRRLPLTELDALLWEPGWRLVEPARFAAAHQAAIEAPRWIIEGLGTRDTIPARLARATEIWLIDLPLGVHLALAEARHAEWTAGRLAHPPAGQATAPPFGALRRTMLEVDRGWMPELRRLAAEAARSGALLHHVTSLAGLEAAMPPR
jgi:hypothetical protein